MRSYEGMMYDSDDSDECDAFRCYSTPKECEILTRVRYRSFEGAHLKNDMIHDFGSGQRFYSLSAWHNSVRWNVATKQC